MIFINKFDKKRLEKVGLWKHERKGRFPQESNFSVCNKQHNSSSKTYYVVENIEVMRFLELWDRANVIQISQTQLEKLKLKKIIHNKNIQKYGEYVIGAKCFIANNGNIYLAKENKLLSALNE